MGVQLNSTGFSSILEMKSKLQMGQRLLQVFGSGRTRLFKDWVDSCSCDNSGYNSSGKRRANYGRYEGEERGDAGFNHNCC